MFTSQEVAALFDAIWSNAVSIIGGTVGVVLLVASLFMEDANYKRIARTIAVTALLLSPIYAWRDEYRAHQTAKNEIQTLKDQSEPKLSVRSIQLTWGKDKDHPKNTFLWITATIINEGADSAILGYRFSAELDGKETIPNAGLIENYVLWDAAGKPIRKFSQVDALYEKTLTPLKRGGVVSGVLLFIFPNREPREVLKTGSRFRLTFEDYRGKTFHYEGVTSGKSHQPFSYFPGSGGTRP